MYQYNVYLGLEYENRIRVEDDLLKGQICRTYARIYASIFPLFDFFDHRLELYLDFQYRYDFLNTTEETDLNHPLLTTGINFNLLPYEDKRQLKIGLDYIKGDNPAKGLLDQEYFQLVLKFKI